MQTLEYHTRKQEKKEWGKGPWQSEPDKIQYLDPETNMPCLIVRGPVGALCGYVGVSENHPLFGKDYDAAYEQANLDVHGGLTFADKCQNTDKRGEEGSICHKVEEGEDDNIWWFGFDCAHCGDIVPSCDTKTSRKRLGLSSPMFGNARDGDTYRDINYVRAQCAQLAKQLKALEKGKTL